MKNWLRRIRGAIGMGLTWAAVWGPAAVVIGTTIIDPTNAHDEMWIAIGALPGFIGGVLFSKILGIAARRRRFDELTVPRFAAFGAVAGVLLGLFPFLIIAGGEPTATHPEWLLAAEVYGGIVFASALSAASTLAIARVAERRELRAADASFDEVGLSEEEARKLLGGGGHLE